MLLAALANEQGAARDIVALNAGASIYVAGLAPTVAEGVEKAQAVIASGAARRSSTISWPTPVAYYLKLPRAQARSKAPPRKGMPGPPRSRYSPAHPGSQGTGAGARAGAEAVCRAAGRSKESGAPARFHRALRSKIAAAGWP